MGLILLGGLRPRMWKRARTPIHWNESGTMLPNKIDCGHPSFASKTTSKEVSYGD